MASIIKKVTTKIIILCNCFNRIICQIVHVKVNNIVWGITIFAIIKLQTDSWPNFTRTSSSIKYAQLTRVGGRTLKICFIKPRIRTDLPFLFFFSKFYMQLGIFRSSIPPSLNSWRVLFKCDLSLLLVYRLNVIERPVLVHWSNLL